MKKYLFICLLLAIAGMMATGCAGCQSANKEQPNESAYHDYDGVVQDFTAGASHIQALHKQTMYSLIKGIEQSDNVTIERGYEWRNSRVIFNDTLTLENIDDLHITDINDRFCYWHPNKGMQVQYIDVNVKNGTQIPWPVSDVWIEDDNLDDKPIKLSCEDALQRLKEWNGVLPKGCNFITLRLPVGPRDCNPQWTFGNTYDVLFIDAVTGEVRDSNPAFPQGK